jgi:peptidylprolyl isomerase
MASEGDTVEIHYTGTLEDGTIFGTSVGNKALEVTLGTGQLIVGFEEAVYGLKVGGSKTVTIPAEEAYGLHRDDLVIVLEKEQLPADLEPKINQQLEIMLTDGSTTNVIVTDASETTITVDGNHPLAGKDLTFEIELVGIN